MHWPLDCIPTEPDQEPLPPARALGCLFSVAGFAITLGVLVWLLWPTEAKAHSWYSGTMEPVTGHMCCNEEDCDEIGASEVRELAGGAYLYIPTGEMIPAARVQQSRDWQYHRCRYTNTFTDLTGVLRKEGSTRCFFVPPGAM